MSPVKILFRYHFNFLDWLQVLLQTHTRILFNKSHLRAIDIAGRRASIGWTEHHRIDNIPPAKQAFIASQYHVHSFTASLVIDKFKIDLITLFLKTFQFIYPFYIKAYGRIALT